MSDVKKSHKAGLDVLRVIRRVKDNARNSIYRALHHAESSLAGALGMVRFPKRSKKGRKRSKRRSSGASASNKEG